MDANGGWSHLKHDVGTPTIKLPFGDGFRPSIYGVFGMVYGFTMVYQMIRLSLPYLGGFCSSFKCAWAGMGRHGSSQVFGVPWTLTLDASPNIWQLTLLSVQHPMCLDSTWWYVPSFVSFLNSWSQTQTHRTSVKQPVLAFLCCSSSCCFTRSACSRRMARASRRKRCMVLVCRYLPSLVWKITKICPGFVKGKHIGPMGFSTRNNWG